MKNKKLKIVYEDKHIIVVNKPPKLLTVSTLKEKEATLYHEVRLYLKRKNKNNKVFIVHRLDYDTSGLVLFAKDIETKNYFQEMVRLQLQHILKLKKIIIILYLILILKLEEKIKFEFSLIMLVFLFWVIKNIILKDQTQIECTYMLIT